MSKLTEAKTSVDKLKAEAGRDEQILDEKQAEANVALQQITSTMRSANTQKTEMNSLREQTLIKNNNIIERY